MPYTKTQKGLFWAVCSGKATRKGLTKEGACKLAHEASSLPLKPSKKKK